MIGGVAAVIEDVAVAGTVDNVAERQLGLDSGTGTALYTPSLTLDSAAGVKSWSRTEDP